MKTVIVGVVLVTALGAGLWKVRTPAAAKPERRVALAGGIYTTEPPGIIGLYEESDEGPRFTFCDTGEVYRVEGSEEGMGKLKLAYRSLRVQASDGIVAELYGVADGNRKQGIFELQGIRSVHPRLDGECVPAR